jgi:hypothetical protein
MAFVWVNGCEGLHQKRYYLDTSNQELDKSFLKKQAKSVCPAGGTR